MDKIKRVISLFFAFFKIGLFTFGGGYAMLALMEAELCSRREWITKDEFLDVAAIAESTPGPIAINAATFIGYRRAGFFGALFATLGVVLPSFTIIYVISQVLDDFLKFKYVGYAFRGIQVAVVYLILSAGIKLLKSARRRGVSVIILSATTICMILLSVLSVSFSSIFYILISGCVGICCYLCSMARRRGK